MNDEVEYYAGIVRDWLKPVMYREKVVRFLRDQDDRIAELEAKYEAQVVQAGRYYAENKGLRDFLKDKGWDIAPVVWKTDD